MGTRADFYIGKGKDAEWIGSFAFDGYRDGIPDDILKAKRRNSFIRRVNAFLKKRDDATFPKDGWPWPWETSATTDCSYWLFDGRCWEAYGYPDEYWVPADKPIKDEDKIGEEAFNKWLRTHERTEFPDMSDKMNVTMGKRSGLLVISVP